MRFIFEIYFGVNILMCGVYLGEREFKSAVLCLFVGASLIIVELFVDYMIKPINNLFQIQFYFNFFILRKYRNDSKENLIVWNRITKNRFASNSLRDRIWRHCMKIRNKANNYDPEKA